MVHLGDINQNLWNLHENNTFFTTKHKLFKTIPYMPVIGNNDGKPISQYDAIYDIDNWYSFGNGPLLRIIVLSGFDVLDKIASVQTGRMDKPNEAVTMKARIIE